MNDSNIYYKSYKQVLKIFQDNVCPDITWREVKLLLKYYDFDMAYRQVWNRGKPFNVGKYNKHDIDFIVEYERDEMKEIIEVGRRTSKKNYTLRDVDIQRSKDRIETRLREYLSKKNYIIGEEFDIVTDKYSGEPLTFGNLVDIIYDNVLI